MKALLLLLGIAAGIVVFLYGTAQSFAASMAGDPYSAARGVNFGCGTAIAGLVIFFGCIIGFFL